MGAHADRSVAFRQLGFSLRFAWGTDGARGVAGPQDVIVVVDVLRFSTAVSVAADQGTAVIPYRWRDPSAADVARERRAVLAASRQEEEPGRSQPGLSPAALRRAEVPERLLLPSPNGGTIVHELGQRSLAVASLRNATAVAEWAAAEVAANPAAGVTVVAAGEYWSGGGLRPAAEDLWGAGAVVQALSPKLPGPASPEALDAAVAFQRVEKHLHPSLRRTGSGRELEMIGFDEDVEIAAEYDESRVVPVLEGDALVGRG